MTAIKKPLRPTVQIRKMPKKIVRVHTKCDEL
jgi:hypothetical protein